MEPGSAKWRIDTLDARGGLAFASWREADLEEGARLFDRPVFHFSPPAFTAIPVASPATALAAERHGFQMGLLDAEGEIPFENLTDVAEFVRRVYIGSGRSDGDDGDDSPVPPPEGEPPDLPPEIETVEGSSLRTGAGAFLTKVNSTPRGTANEVDWKPQFGEAKGADSHSSLIMRGSELMLIEMLARFPQSDDEQKLERWYAAATRLADTLFRIGAAHFLDSKPSIGLRNACQKFVSSAWGWDDTNDIIWGALNLMANRHPRDWRPVWAASGEPFDDLAHFPVNRRHAEVASARDPDRASVADVVSSVVASPGKIVNTADLDAIIMFAAARIVAFDGAPWLCPDWRYGRMRHAQGIKQLAAQARKWLARELPRLCFSPSVEELLNSPLASPPRKREREPTSRCDAR